MAGAEAIAVVAGVYIALPNARLAERPTVEDR